LLCDDPVVVEDEEAAVEELTDLDLASVIAAVAGAGWDVEDAAGEGDDVVGGDGSRVAAAEGVVEVEGRGAPGGRAVSRRVGEAAVEALEESGEEGASFLEGLDARELHLGDEAVLEGAPQALDAALGLRAGGTDVADAELVEGLAELGGALAAGELFLKGPVGVVADEDVGAVAVEGAGQSVAGEDVEEELGVAMEVLLVTEDESQDGVGGVVDHAVQAEDGGLGAPPAALAAVDEAQLAGAGGGFPPAAVGARPAPVLGGHPALAAEPADGLAADGHSPLGEQLGQMAVVEADRARQEVQDLLPDAVLDPASGGPAPAAMDEPYRPLLTNPVLEPPELPHGQLQGLGPVSIGDPSFHCGLHHAQPPGFTY
jgi:hypothetical protein